MVLPPSRPTARRVEVHVPPSEEARRLIRWFPSLVCATDGPWRVVRNVVVAPFSQLTFVSFDLQHFLFKGMHATWSTRISHGLGMFLVVAFGLRGLSLATEGLAVDGGLILAGILVAWYQIVARSAGLPAWGLVAAAQVGLARLLASAIPLDRPWVWMFISAMWISYSHASEELYPPRAGDDLNWYPVEEYAQADGTRWGQVKQVSWMIFMAQTGILSEWWASWRLMPYNLLELMFALGYAPDRRAELHERVERAWATGQPALDFVGVGGGVVLTPTGEPRSE